MIEDAELLRRYAEEKSDAAFGQLVERHLGFVYACALRRVGGNAHLAKDVAQQVFIALARHAAKLVRHEVLSGWLYVATRNAAAQVVRGERRRQAREQEAQTMNEINSDSGAAADWARLRPVLDDALDGLGDDDRRAVLLRFFEGKSFAEVGAKLRLTENAARMRVARALDKLQALLARRGVTSTTGALALALTNQETVAVPAGLAATVAGAAVGGGTLATSGFFSAVALPVMTGMAVTGAGMAAWVFQAKANDALRTELAAMERGNAEVARLRIENGGLARAAADIEAFHGESGELMRLRDEVRELKQFAAERFAEPPVQRPRLVRISGQVKDNSPRELPEGVKLTLRELLAAAELMPLAKQSEIRVTRAKNPRLSDNRVTAESMEVFTLDAKRDGDFVLEPDDTIFVPERLL